VDAEALATSVQEFGQGVQKHSIKSLDSYIEPAEIQRWKIMEYKAAIIVSCWFAVVTISSVYVWVFGSKLADIMFGVFIPIGLLILVAIIVTFAVASSSGPEKNENRINR
jgi:hypothetical protein